jgi:hypothetical protein
MLKPVENTFKNIYARIHTFHRMAASQERAAFFNATLLVVTRHPGGPPGRPKIHPVLPRFALFFIIKKKKIGFIKTPTTTTNAL